MNKAIQLRPAFSDTAPILIAPLTRGVHLPTLDGLRGVAVLMVMVFHFVKEPLFTQSWLRPIFLIAHIGQTGVDLFFVLSGFLITGILVDSKQQPHFFRNFYMRRTLRIFPLYYSVLIILYGVLPLCGAVRWWPAWREAAPHQLWQWLYVTNVATFLDIPQLAGHFWTLSIEEHFYLLWPVVIFLATERTIAYICIGLVMSALLIRTLLAWNGLDTFYLTPCRMDALAVGAWLAIRVRQSDKGEYALPFARQVVLMAILFLMPLYVMQSGSHAAWLQATKFTFIGLLYGAILLLITAADKGSFVARAFLHPALRFFGKYSYGLYVFHIYAMTILFPYVNIRLLTTWLHYPLLAIVCWVLMATVASLVPAWLSWHLLEKHFLQLKRLFAPRSVSCG